VADDGRKQAVDRDADREHDIVVRGADPGSEPGEAGHHHQHPGSVAGPAPPGEHAGPEERPPDQQAEPGGQAAVVRVVAAEHERQVQRPEAEPGRP
jgi:hypothetical protein